MYGENCKEPCKCGQGSERCDHISGCVCQSGWTGTFCDTDINECNNIENPCKNTYGECINNEALLDVIAKKDTNEHQLAPVKVNTCNPTKNVCYI